MNDLAAAMEDIKNNKTFSGLEELARALRLAPESLSSCKATADQAKAL